MERDKRTFKQATANMNRAQKVSYIWLYYKFHIITTIIVILLAVGGVSSLLNRKDTVLNVRLVASGMNVDSLTKLQEKAESELITDKKKQDMAFVFVSDQGADTKSVVGNQQLYVPLAAGDIDIIMIPKEGFEALASQGFFIDLSSIPELSAKSGKELTLLNFKAQVEGESEVEKPYGIDISNFPVLQQLSVSHKDMVLGIVASAKNRDICVNFINWLSKQNGQ